MRPPQVMFTACTSLRSLSKRAVRSAPMGLIRLLWNSIGLQVEYRAPRWRHGLRDGLVEGTGVWMNMNRRGRSAVEKTFHVDG